MRPLTSHIAIDHLLLGTYRGHMPKFILKSQKLNEILRFENFEITRFRHTLTHENSHSSLNFQDTGLIFWISSCLCVLYKSSFATQALRPILKIFIFLIPPSEGGWGKNFKFKFCPKFSFLIFRKSQEVSIHQVKPLQSNNESPKTVALSAPPRARQG